MTAAGAMGQPLQPLSHEECASLLTCLHSALSANMELQKRAEAYIISLEQRPGFITSLAVRCISKLFFCLNSMRHVGFAPTKTADRLTQSACTLARQMAHRRPIMHSPANMHGMHKPELQDTAAHGLKAYMQWSMGMYPPAASA